MTTIKTSFKEVTTEVVTPTLDITVSGYGEEALTSSTLFKRITDDVNSTSNLSIVRSYPYSVTSDILSYSDNAHKSLVSTLPKNVTIADTVSTAVQYNRSISDSVTTNDTYNFNNNFTRSFPENILVADTAIPSIPISSISSTSVVGTDVLNITSNKYCQDNLATIESLSFTIIRYINVTDNLIISEQVTKGVGSTPSPDNINNVSSLSKHIYRLSTDNLGRSENLTYGMQSYTSNNYVVSGYTGTTGTLI